MKLSNEMFNRLEILLQQTAEVDALPPKGTPAGRAERERRRKAAMEAMEAANRRKAAQARPAPVSSAPVLTVPAVTTVPVLAPPATGNAPGVFGPYSAADFPRRK